MTELGSRNNRSVTVGMASEISYNSGLLSELCKFGIFFDISNFEYGQISQENIKSINIILSSYKI